MGRTGGEGLSPIVAHIQNKKKSFLLMLSLLVNKLLLFDGFINSSATLKASTNGASSVGSSPPHLGRVPTQFMKPKYFVQ